MILGAMNGVKIAQTKIQGRTEMNANWPYFSSKPINDEAVARLTQFGPHSGCQTLLAPRAIVIAGPAAD